MTKLLKLSPCLIIVRVTTKFEITLITQITSILRNNIASSIVMEMLRHRHLFFLERHKRVVHHYIKNMGRDPRLYTTHTHTKKKRKTLGIKK